MYMLSCDKKIRWYVALVTWKDRVSSLEVARRCGVRELDAALRVKRLRCCGHVVRRDVTEI